MNAHAERLPRTIQESFVDDHEALLFADLACFSRKLADGRFFTNAERPHHALGQKSPRSFTHPTSARVPKVLDSYSRLTNGLLPP
jgi:transposase InsO family protein